MGGVKEVCVSECRFEKNLARVGGGAISCEGAVSVRITDSDLESNRGKNAGNVLGGAIRIVDVGTLRISNTLFKGNKADGGYGHDLFVLNTPTGNPFTDSCTFSSTSNRVCFSNGEGEVNSFDEYLPFASSFIIASSAGSDNLCLTTQSSCTSLEAARLVATNNPRLPLTDYAFIGGNTQYSFPSSGESKFAFENETVSIRSFSESTATLSVSERSAHVMTLSTGSLTLSNLAISLNRRKDDRYIRSQKPLPEMC